MQWTGTRQKELGVKLGFVVVGEGRESRVVNLRFSDSDREHSSPQTGHVRPASLVEVKMWRELLRA